MKTVEATGTVLATKSHTYRQREVKTNVTTDANNSAFINPVAYLEIRKGECLGVHFQKCSKYSIKRFHIKY